MYNTAISIQIVTNDRAKLFCDRVTIEPNKSIKDPEKQEKWMEAKRAKLQETAKLYPLCGQIACISIYDDVKGQAKSFISKKESELLYDFFEHIHDDNDQLYCRNKYFFVPYLIKRAVANKIGIPSQVRYIKDVKEAFGEFGMSAYSNQSEMTNDMSLVNVDFIEAQHEQIETYWNMWKSQNDDLSKLSIISINENLCLNTQTLIARAYKPFSIDKKPEDIPF